MIETLSQNPLSLVLIFPVVTLTVFVVGIIRIDLAKFQEKHVSGKEEEYLYFCHNQSLILDYEL